MIGMKRMHEKENGSMDYRKELTKWAVPLKDPDKFVSQEKTADVINKLQIKAESLKDENQMLRDEILRTKIENKKLKAELHEIHINALKIIFTTSGVNGD